MNEEVATSAENLLLKNQICFPLYAASRLVVQTYRPFLEELGLTYAQYLVLMVLWERDGMTVSELGERLLLDSGTLTPVLKRLQAQGLVERARRPTDERIVENRLSPAGKKLKRKAAKVPNAMMCEVGLELREAEQIRDVLGKLIERLKVSAARAGGEP
jgi:DNA-binding MarR family transcriptional regulator